MMINGDAWEVEPEFWTIGMMLGKAGVVEVDTSEGSKLLIRVNVEVRTVWPQESRNAVETAAQSTVDRWAT